MVLSVATDGLIRFPVDLQNKNPKDPPIQANALFDTGANCNIISKKKFSDLIGDNILSSAPSRRIRFPDNSKSESCPVAMLSFTIEHNGQLCQFEEEFLVCLIAEDVIFGRNLLDTTGLLHLVITHRTAPNPFEQSLNNITLDHLDDTIDEEDDTEVPPVGFLPLLIVIHPIFGCPLLSNLAWIHRDYFVLWLGLRCTPT